MTDNLDTIFAQAREALETHEATPDDLLCDCAVCSARTGEPALSWLRALVSGIEALRAGSCACACHSVAGHADEPTVSMMLAEACAGRDRLRAVVARLNREIAEDAQASLAAAATRRAGPGVRHRAGLARPNRRLGPRPARHKKEPR